jgi:hypothetical protein
VDEGIRGRVLVLAPLVSVWLCVCVRVLLSAGMMGVGMIGTVDIKKRRKTRRAVDFFGP